MILLPEIMSILIGMSLDEIIENFVLIDNVLIQMQIILEPTQIEQISKDIINHLLKLQENYQIDLQYETSIIEQKKVLAKEIREAIEFGQSNDSIKILIAKSKELNQIQKTIQKPNIQFIVDRLGKMISMQGSTMTHNLKF